MAQSIPRRQHWSQGSRLLAAGLAALLAGGGCSSFVGFLAGMSVTLLGVLTAASL